MSSRERPGNTARPLAPVRSGWILPAGTAGCRVFALDDSTLLRLYRDHAVTITAHVIRLANGDFGLAEESVQEAFTAALEQWRASGVPENARAWLFKAARNKAIDRLRRQSRFEAELDETTEPRQWTPDDDSATEHDDTLRLVFTCCHPALSLEAQVALTLRTLCGLSTEEIARAFLVEPETMAQRLVRAKNKIRVAKIPYVIPERDDLPERLDAVLGVVYLVFGEGYAATAGDSLLRRELTNEAIRLGRLVERLMPERPEPTALVALMLLHDARRDARIDERGDLVLLEDQDRRLWDRAQIAEGLAKVEQALRGGPVTSYAVQAAIAALHARSEASEATDWPQIALLYEKLMEIAPSPVVALNRAAAVAMAEGPDRGLALLDALRDDDAMRSYHLYFAARADLSRRAGRHDAARADYERALSLVRNDPERRFLEKRLAALAS